METQMRKINRKNWGRYVNKWYCIYQNDTRKCQEIPDKVNECIKLLWFPKHKVSLMSLLGGQPEIECWRGGQSSTSTIGERGLVRGTAVDHRSTIHTIPANIRSLSHTDFTSRERVSDDMNGVGEIVICSLLDIFGLLMPPRIVCVYLYRFKCNFSNDFGPTDF